MFKLIRSTGRAIAKKSQAGFMSMKAMLSTVTLSALAFMAGPAFAGGGGPDLSSIVTEINAYKTAVVALVIAFAVVLWAIRAAGLAKPR